MQDGSDVHVYNLPSLRAEYNNNFWELNSLVCRLTNLFGLSICEG